MSAIRTLSLIYKANPNSAELYNSSQSLLIVRPVLRVSLPSFLRLLFLFCRHTEPLPHLKSIIVIFTLFQVPPV
jgi:hypothetical protein